MPNLKRFSDSAEAKQRIKSTVDQFQKKLFICFVFLSMKREKQTICLF